MVRQPWARAHRGVVKRLRRGPLALLPVLVLVSAFATPSVQSAATQTEAAPTTPVGDGAEPSALEHYLDNLSSLRTSFTQSVSDAHGQLTDGGTGKLLVQRPGRFRWEYLPRNSGADRAQLLVADGHNLWFYDHELAQVTVKPVAQALTATPMMLLSGTSEDLKNAFNIKAAAARDGMEWVLVQPHGNEGDFSGAELGFRGNQLTRMIVHDRLGQTVTLDFSGGVRNAPIAASEFEFAPPPGVDVIGAPEH